MNKQANQSGEQDRLDYISKILKSHTIYEVRANIESFLAFVESNKKYRRSMCRKLFDSVIKFASPYLTQSMFAGGSVVVVEPSHAPVFLISTCIPLTDDPEVIIHGLRAFLRKCDEYINPVQNAITADETDMVIDIAQRKLGLLDVIARNRSLKIVRLNNSHIRTNCECGISEHEAVILVYHPKDVSVCDRVFIFAHEIGHALHLALTGDVEIIPDGFDEFNKLLGVEHQTIEQKQEAFADVTAFAILNCDELKTHLPHNFSDLFLNYSEKFICQAVHNRLEL